jgi:hypothetical protein
MKLKQTPEQDIQDIQNIQDMSDLSDEKESRIQGSHVPSRWIEMLTSLRPEVIEIGQMYLLYYWAFSFVRTANLFKVAPAFRTFGEYPLNEDAWAGVFVFIATFTLVSTLFRILPLRIIAGFMNTFVWIMVTSLTYRSFSSSPGNGAWLGCCLISVYGTVTLFSRYGDKLGGYIFARKEREKDAEVENARAKEDRE